MSPWFLESSIVRKVCWAVSKSVSIVARSSRAAYHPVNQKRIASRVYTTLLLVVHLVRAILVFVSDDWIHTATTDNTRFGLNPKHAWLNSPAFASDLFDR